jgi:hypothetical protein
MSNSLKTRKAKQKAGHVLFVTNHNRHSMQSKPIKQNHTPCGKSSANDIMIVCLASGFPDMLSACGAFGMGRSACDIPPCPAFYSVLPFLNPL